MAASRRYTLTQRIVTLIVAFCLLRLIVSDGRAAPAEAPTRYAVTEIGLLPGSDHASAEAINDSGEAVGWARVQAADYPYHAFRWRRGEITDLGNINPNLGQNFVINRAGQVVGPWWDPNSLVVAAIWQGGKPATVGQGMLRAINDKGQAVGDNGVSHTFPAPGFLWTPSPGNELGMKTQIAGLRGFIEPRAINSSGEVVGAALEGFREGFGQLGTRLTDRSLRSLMYPPGRAFLWSNGKMIDLGTLGGEHSGATAINDRGQVVGWANTAKGEVHAFLWTPIVRNGMRGSIIDLGTLGGKTSVAMAINASGQVVGQAEISPSSVGNAFLYTDGKMYDLNRLITGNAGLVLLSARGINSKGLIVGNAYNRKHEGRAFLLTSR